MRKTYMMLFALVLSVLGATSAFGQKIYRAEIDDSFFKAWTSNEPGATEVTNPDPVIDVKDDGTEVVNNFKCDNNLYKEVGAWTGIWGSSIAYYLWYADLTGTQTLYFKGTPGFKFWVQFNRKAPVEGGDTHGGDMVQQELTVGDDGYASYDCSSLPYVHLNCIKTKGTDIRGRLTAIEIEGTIKPVSGLLSLISNGDAEGDDVSSFPVSYDGPNNGGTANDKPEIVSGGVGGSRCFKVKAHENPSESWHTQFYIKADEVMPKGSKWSLKMSIKADQPDTKITTSAQAAPRTWKGGFVDEFFVGTEWKEFTWSGEIGVDDFQSIAFDLNNGDETVPNTDNLNGKGDGTVNVSRGITFYFDNIEFGYDLGSANPASDITASFGVDVIEVNLTGTNIPDLVKAGDGKKVILPNDCVEISWNGKPGHPVSVEGRPNGNLYIFMLDVDGDEDYAFDKDDENSVIKIGFTNPTDPAYRLLFTEGKWEGQPVPDFSGVVCSYKEELGSGDYVSYIWGAADLETVEPEDGSFNLATDLNTFTLTFNQKIEVATVVASLGKEKLKASAAEEFSKVITLTRTAAGALAGETKLIVDHAVTDRGYDLDDPIVLKYSFGPVVADENNQPEVLYTSNFTQDDADPNAYGAGWIVTADNKAGMQPANSGSGNRLQHGQTGYAADVLYLAQRSAAAGIALYGTEEDHKLTLKGGKTYHLTLKSAQWDAYPSTGSNRSLRAQVLTEDAVSVEDGTILDESGILGEQFQVVDGRVKEDKAYTAFDVAFTPEADGNFVIRLVSGDLNGNPNGTGDGNAIADVKVEYIPSTMGLMETKALDTALETAKETLDANNEERYAGPALTTLDNLIKEYDGKTMTAPSAFAKATEDLNNAVKALNDHVTLCNDYDKLPGQAFNLYEKNKGTKFEATENFKTLEAVVKKYCTFGTETQTDDEGNEITVEVMESFTLFYDDAELTAAKNELSDVIDMANKIFSEGKSHNWYGGRDRTYGYAALHERLRRGVELLKSLGVSEDAAEIVNANAELGDNDELAEAIIWRANQIILGDLAGEGTLFAGGTTDENGEEVNPSYDLSVYAKNPNIYAPANSTEIPGWGGNGNTWAFPAWGVDHTVNTPYAEDCQIHAGWHPQGLPTAEQTIEGLPAGIYTIKVDCSDNSGTWVDTYAFVKTSAQLELEEGETLDPDVHFAGYRQSSGDIENIEVLDGKLTVGFLYGPESQAFINDVEIWMTSPIAGHDYAADLATDIDAAKTAKVRAIEMYDLNGRRISTARKGLVIVKKVMSDGTVKTSKVIK